ncbi:MAG: hypothetical protein JWM27_1188 [Gemmatimonadetes bacterium]|nr:hypothetical protein [Gemmatimonadota bacterium]
MRVFLAAAACSVLLASTGHAQTGRRATVADRQAVAVPQGRPPQIVTPIDIAFEAPAEYDAFADGRLALRLVLVNTRSGQTIRITPAQVREGFTPGADRSHVSLRVVIDNLAGPLGDWEHCVDTRLTGASLADSSGVEITVGYTGCGTADAPAIGTAIARAAPGQPIGGLMIKGGSNPGSRNVTATSSGGATPPPDGTAAQATPGGPIGGIIVRGGRVGESARVAGGPIIGIIVKAGKNPPATFRISMGPSMTGPAAEAPAQARAPGTIIIASSKGNGSPKAQGF